MNKGTDYRKDALGAASPERARLLVIEDNPADVELLRYVLDSAEVQCELTVIHDGGEALAFVQRRGKYSEMPLPHLAIVDLNLPRYDGIEILEAMRDSQVFSGTPVVVMSSSSSPSDRSRIEELRIGRYLTKPPDLDGYMRVGIMVKQMLDGNPDAE